MVQRIYGLLLAIVCSFAMSPVTVSQGANAQDWRTAERLYAKRDTGRAAIAQARTAYKSILRQARGADAIRAVSQLGRLAIFEGEMVLPKTAHASRAAVYRDCWENVVERIKPSAESVRTRRAHPAYFYFKAVCLAYWGEAIGPVRAISKAGELKETINKGRALDTRFEGGGIFRVGAALFSDTKARAIGLYNTNQALKDADLALRQRAFPGDPNPGNLWFDNYQAKAMVLIRMGRKADAKRVLQVAVEEIEFLKEENELPRGRVPETEWNLRVMKRLLRSL